MRAEGLEQVDRLHLYRCILLKQNNYGCVCVSYDGEAWKIIDLPVTAWRFVPDGVNGSSEQSIARWTYLCRRSVACFCGKHRTPSGVFTGVNKDSRRRLNTHLAKTFALSALDEGDRGRI